MLPGIGNVVGTAGSFIRVKGFSDDFTGTDGQLLSARPGWKLAYGTDGLKVSSNALLQGANATKFLYTRGAPVSSNDGVTVQAFLGTESYTHLMAFAQGTTPTSLSGLGISVFNNGGYDNGDGSYTITLIAQLENIYNGGVSQVIDQLSQDYNTFNGVPSALFVKLDFRNNGSAGYTFYAFGKGKVGTYQTGMYGRCGLAKINGSSGTTVDAYADTAYSE